MARLGQKPPKQVQFYHLSEVQLEDLVLSRMGAILRAVLSRGYLPT